MNNIALVTNMIGANEHESHHLHALTNSISSEITIKRLATDTEGSNKVNYVLLRGKKIEYTPCYKTLKQRVASLVSFQPVDYYNNANTYIIKPCEKAKTALIARNWEKVKPILAAVWTEGVQSSTIVKKLCMQKQKNTIKDALFAYNDIFRTQHILRYISDEDYRRYIRRVLNRGEAYHLLRRKIAEAHGGKFRGGSDDEIAIWNERGRLIANAIIFYNAYMLSALLEKMEAEGNTQAAEFIKRLSPIACQHINFNGLFEFKLGENMIDVEAIVSMLGKIVQAAVKK